MHELPPEAEALLAAARRELPIPDAGASERVRRSVAAAIAVGSLAPGLHAAATKAAIKATAKPFLALPFLVKAGVGVVTIATLGALVGPALFQVQRAPHAAHVAPERRELPVPPASEPVARAPESVAPQDIAQAVAPPAPRPTKSAVMRPAARANSSLGAELSLLDQVSRALDVHDAKGAQALLARYRATFRQPLLAEERDGLELISLCMQDSEKAQPRLEAYLARAGRSVLRARIERVCRRTP